LVKYFFNVQLKIVDTKQRNSLRSISLALFYKPHRFLGDLQTNQVVLST
jgi:hypothetical protein